MNIVRTLKLLVFAMGGEGGLTLAHWLGKVAEEEDYLIQYTSLPGVAQRTGATTYYIEMISKKDVAEAGMEPIFSLEPAPGDVDIILASELLEAVRAVDLGFVTADKTTLITSTHRSYLYSEKSVSGNGIIPDKELEDRLVGAAEKTLFGDFNSAVISSGSHMSSVLLGAVAGSGSLPFKKASYEKILSAAPGSSAQNIKGFETGFGALGSTKGKIKPALKDPDGPVCKNEIIFENAIRELPSCMQEVSRLGIARLVDYQGPAYARLYLQRLANITNIMKESSHKEREVLREFSRQLALWMSYEDVIRVAQLKTRPSRLKNLARKAAHKGSIIQVVDFLRPGIEEFASLLPDFLAKPILRSRMVSKAFEKTIPPLRIKTSGFLGFSILFLLRGLRPLRPLTSRFTHEQLLMEKWMECVSASITSSPDVAWEIVQCPGLIKGYGKTRLQGEKFFSAIMDYSTYARNAKAAEKIAALREAAENDAQNDQAGKRFDELIRLT